MVLSVLFGWWVGQWADGKLDTEPYLTAVGFALGVGAAIRAVIRVHRDAQRDMKKDGFRASMTDRPARYALDQDGRASRAEDRASSDSDRPARAEHDESRNGRE
jgi:hypothetical protein